MPSFEFRKRRGKLIALINDDGTEYMRLDAQLVYDEGLREGREYSEDELCELKERSDALRAKRSAYYMISCRDYSEKELRRKLSMKTTPQAADEAVEKMRELKMLDDESYARNLASQYLEHKHYAAKRILLELRQKGIDSDLAQQVVDELEIDENEQLETLLSGKLGEGLDDEKTKARVFNKLSRYGYRSGNISRAIRNRADSEE